MFTTGISVKWSIGGNGQANDKEDNSPLGNYLVSATFKSK